MGKYSLVAIDENNNREIIKMKEVNKSGKPVYKERVKLSTIDSNTTYFANMDEMIKYLVDNQIINITPKTFVIEYQLNGTKTLPIIFKNNQLIKYFSKRSDSYVPVEDKYYINLIDDLLDRFNDKKYYYYMVKNGYLNIYLKNKIEEYVFNEENTMTDPEFIRKNILEEASSYKIVRGLIIGTAIYDKHIKNQKEYPEVAVSKKESKEKKELTEEEKEIIKIELEKALKEAEIEKIHNDKIDAYRVGGYDELYTIYDEEDIENTPDLVKKQFK